MNLHQILKAIHTYPNLYLVGTNGLVEVSLKMFLLLSGDFYLENIALIVHRSYIFKLCPGDLRTDGAF